MKKKRKVDNLNQYTTLTGMVGHSAFGEISVPVNVDADVQPFSEQHLNRPCPVVSTQCYHRQLTDLQHFKD